MSPEAKNRSTRVLVHAPFGRDGALLRDVLERAGIEAVTCSTIEELYTRFFEGAGVILIGDEAFTPSGLDRLRTILEGQPPWSDIPVFVMTRPMENRYSLSRLLEGLGNVSLLDRPMRTEMIVRTFQMALRARIRQYDTRDYLETERRSAANLAAANSELQRVNGDLNQFAYSASHDLQEPLRMVSLYVELLRKEYGAGLGPEASQYMAFALEGSKRMELLLGDLLSYLQVVNSKETEIPRTDSNKILSSALENLQNAIDECGAKIKTGPLPILPITPVHLLQLFQNLLGNALKYHSEIPPEILISAARKGALWKFSIRDNGIGIEPEFAQYIFGVFKRLHGGNGKYNGTGIGLAICQRIVERYGGRIWVESEGPGKGSAFSFTLPAADRDESETGFGV